MNGMMDGSWGLNALCQEELDEALLNSEREERLEKREGREMGLAVGLVCGGRRLPMSNRRGHP